MAARLAGIALILIGATLAWLVLAATLLQRTESSDASQRASLAALWGAEQTQAAPLFALAVAHADRKGHVTVTETPLGAAGSRIDTDLALAERRKGLLWYNTYAVRFAAAYTIDDPGSAGRLVVRFPFPSQTATYDDFSLLIDGKRIRAASEGGMLVASVPAPRGRSAAVSVGYRSHGLGTWTYRFGEGVVGVRNFRLTMRTNFAAIDFPPQTLAPTDERRTADGWRLTWRYRELVAGFGIGMAFPQHVQPGPLAQRITLWAPLSLLFYVFVMLVITTLRRIDLHPINYFFLAAAFFAFHLLFAYTVDRIRIEYAFALCSVVSMTLTITYLRLVAGWRFAAVEAALAQFFYLILFSYALFDEGYSGLSITIGAIATLFVTMQLTGRIRWGERVRTVRRDASAAMPPA